MSTHTTTADHHDHHDDHELDGHDPPLHAREDAIPFVVEAREPVDGDPLPDGFVYSSGTNEETLSVEERLRRVLVHVQRQIGMLEAQEEIKSAVQEELGERQREIVLREQLKAIQQELGEGDDASDLEELRERVQNLELGDDAGRVQHRIGVSRFGTGVLRCRREGHQRCCHNEDWDLHLTVSPS